jgi:ubiquitin-conjugating enzyme E2 Q
MSLNEIVNCPTQFASASPYLVVQHIDWIQCRYLFVQVSATDGGYSGFGSNNVSQ